MKRIASIKLEGSTMRDHAKIINKMIKYRFKGFGTEFNVSSQLKGTLYLTVKENTNISQESVIYFLRGIASHITLL